MNTPEPSLTFDDTLNITLQALLQERQSLESCLEEYPHYAAELKPLLQTALLTQRLKKPVMSEERVAALEERLMQAFPTAPMQADDDAPMLPVRRPLVLFPAWMSRSAAIVALVFLAALGTGGGTVAASANSVPGETLYSVKRAWEGVIFFLASLIGRVNEVQLHLAHVRWQELETLAQRDQIIPDGVWQGFIQTFTDAYQEADAQEQNELMQVLANVDKTVTEAALPSDYRADLLMLPHPPNNDQVLLPVATQTAEATDLPAQTAIPTSTEAPTEALLVAGTPTEFNVIVATITRTPTPSRTPTATFTPSGTPSPITPLPSPTATYTRLPLAIPSQTPLVIPTQSGDSPPDVITDPGEVPQPPPDEGGGDDPPDVPPSGTIDPIIRPTMRSVYATQTALANWTEPSETPEMP